MLFQNSAPLPFLVKSIFISATDLSCRSHFYSVPFELCGRTFGQLATLGGGGVTRDLRKTQKLRKKSLMVKDHYQLSQLSCALSSMYIISQCLSALYKLPEYMLLAACLLHSPSPTCLLHAICLPVCLPASLPACLSV